MAINPRLARLLDNGHESDEDGNDEGHHNPFLRFLPTESELLHLPENAFDCPLTVGPSQANIAESLHRRVFGVLNNNNTPVQNSASTTIF
jgi:hypothetical protein